MKKTFAVVLSGCGRQDGAEINESVLTMLAIDQLGGTYRCFAPDMDQRETVNHLTGRITGKTRNVLVESARIARGEVSDLSEYDPASFDALVFPGGAGAVKNLCGFAESGAECGVHEAVERAVRLTCHAGKPIGAMCIAPVLITRILRDVEVTVGNDAQTAAAITVMGGRHKRAGRGQVVVDINVKLATTPCYMLPSTISEIADGARNLIETLIGMM
ncbi:MAG: isoprenoid biosynthesis glyoxalase ElbB [Pseudomonadota bacterium]|nr:isoprenoid biosynthesis glyoxalase ElbB [Pseudomonadota bacterium]